MQLINNIIRPLVSMVKKTELLSAGAPHLVKLTGKHREKIHPKHLICIREPWYLKYLKNTDMVLDVGCHNGQQTLKAAGVCKFIIGFDQDKIGLELARREAKRRQITNARFVWGNAEAKLAYKNSSFDTILFLDVYEHLSNRFKTLREISRVMKNRGRLLISVPKSDTGWKKLQKTYGLNYFSDPDHKVEFTAKEIQKELAAFGFHVLEIMPVTFDTPWVGIIDLIGGISLSAYALLSKWRRDKAMKNPQESIGLELVCQKVKQV